MGLKQRWRQWKLRHSYDLLSDARVEELGHQFTGSAHFVHVILVCHRDNHRRKVRDFLSLLVSPRRLCAFGWGRAKGLAWRMRLLFDPKTRKLIRSLVLIEEHELIGAKIVFGDHYGEHN
jgi:hypothetical protein